MNTLTHMVVPVRLPIDVYNQLKERAGKTERSMSKTAELILKSALSKENKNGNQTTRN